MKWGIFRSEVDPQEGFNEQLAAARAPYAQAWKDFDKLQKRLKGQGGYRWVHFVIGTVLPYVGGGAFGLALWRHHKAYVIAGLILLVAWGAFNRGSLRSRFAEWPCPRCHSVWPGTKNEKDSSCRVCGLRLHQMAP